MTIDLKLSGEKFKEVRISLEAHSADSNKPHSYLKITKAENGSIECSADGTKDDHATLAEINEFVTLCLAQESTRGTKDLDRIKFGLGAIKDKVTNDTRSCLKAFWYLVAGGASIVGNSGKLLTSFLQRQDTLDELLNSILKKEAKGKFDKALEKKYQAAQICEHTEPLAAFELYKNAHFAGHIPSKIRLAKCFEGGELGQNKNLKDASHGYLDAAECYLKIDRIKAKEHYLNALRCDLNVYAVVALGKHFTLDKPLLDEVSALAPNKEKFAEVLYEAGIKLSKEKNNLKDPNFLPHKNASLLMSRLDAENYPLAIEWMADVAFDDKYKSEQYIRLAIIYTEKKEFPKSFKCCEKAADLGNLNAINRLILCFISGGLDQTPNPQSAAKYLLMAAKVYFESNKAEECKNNCGDAYKRDPKQAVLFVISDLNTPILGIFTLDEIIRANCSVEIGNAFLAKAKSLQKDKPIEAQDNFKHAIELGNNIEAVIQYGLNNDLNSIISDQQKRADLYYQAAGVLEKQEGSYTSNPSHSILYRKAHYDGHIEAKVKLASIDSNNAIGWNYLAAEAYEKKGDFASALKYYLQANYVNSKNIDPVIKLAHGYKEGLFGEKDPVTAAGYYFKAATDCLKEHEEIGISKINLPSSPTIQPDKEKAVALFIESAKLDGKYHSLNAAEKVYEMKKNLNDISDNQVERAKLYFELAKRSYLKKAITFCEEAYKEGSAIAAETLGIAYRFSDYKDKFQVTSDKTKAKEYFVIAAARYRIDGNKAKAVDMDKAAQAL